VEGKDKILLWKVILMVSGNHKEAMKGEKCVLMICYAFPPLPYAGTFRSLRFCKYLEEFGWRPTVMTIKKYGDLASDESLMSEVPPGVKIYRTATLDLWRTYRKIREKGKKGEGKREKEGNGEKNGKSIKGSPLRRIAKYFFTLLTTPDHMNLWTVFAVFNGIYLILKEKCDLIYTSSPPHSAHLSGLILSKIFRKPWIADFRDPWVDADDFIELTGGYQSIAGLHRRLEGIVIRNASKVLMISSTYTNELRKRYKEISAGKIVALTNGYDGAHAKIEACGALFRQFTILHAGTFYSNRRPTIFLDGLQIWLDRKGKEARGNTQVVFLGAKDEMTKGEVVDRGLEDVVSCHPLIPQGEAMRMMRSSHLLLLIIGLDQKSKGVLTSKLFDYLAVKKPILGILPEGDAAAIIRECHAGYLVTEEDANIVADYLDETYDCYKAGTGQMLPFDEKAIGMYASKTITQKLAGIFNECL
jgi:glycosyltransferase involved in cell wall biosynthesis